MIEVLSKPTDQVAVGDIESLIESEVPEGEQIEFKESLSTPGDSTDPWMSGENRIGEPAKKKILKEVTAFANAYGGVLLLGIGESDTQPPVAAKISPIPRCADLAKRLKLVFRDCVEPQLPRIEIFAVQTEGDKGVVLIRVGKSRLAPHRVTKTLVCPVRRADRCEEMTMREIQDMTLNVSRGLERLERRLSERAERFQQEFKRLDAPENAYGVRLTAVPIGDEIRFERVFRQGGLAENLDIPWLTVRRQKDNNILDLETPFNFSYTHWRPILRGARAETGRHHFIGYRELHCDGLIELGFVSGRLHPGYPFLSPDWPIVLFANLIDHAHRVRNQAGFPVTEYAIEVVIFSIAISVPVVRESALGRFSRNYPLDEFLEDHGLGKLGPGSIKFPQYSLGDRDEIPKLLALFRRDLWNSLGKDIGTEEGVLRVDGWPN